MDETGQKHAAFKYYMTSCLVFVWYALAHIFGEVNVHMMYVLFVVVGSNHSLVIVLCGPCRMHLS